MAAHDEADEFDAVFFEEFADQRAEALCAEKHQHSDMITTIIPPLPSARRPKDDDGANCSGFCKK